MTGARRALRIVLALALAALAACSDTPPTALFTLVPRPGVQIDRPVGAIAVRAVEVAHYLDRPQIVRHRDEYELKTNDFERWGEGMGDMVTRVLVENLALRLPAAQITISASPVTVESRTSVAVDIARFDPDPEGTVILEAHWTIRRGTTGEPVRLERITAPVGSPAMRDLVAAMSDCLGQLSDHIAQALAAAP